MFARKKTRLLDNGLIHKVIALQLQLKIKL